MFHLTNYFFSYVVINLPYVLINLPWIVINLPYMGPTQRFKMLILKFNLFALDNTLSLICFFPWTSPKGPFGTECGNLIIQRYLTSFGRTSLKLNMCVCLN
jgi:hypothetical protein